MKSVLVTATVGASSLLLGGNAFATDGVSVSPSNTEAKVKIQVAEPRMQDISVYVADAEGSIVYQEKIKAKTTFGKTYDLSDLDDGIYTIASSGEYITTTKQIRVEGSSATELSKKAAYKPVMVVKDNYLKVNYFNKAQEDIEFSLVGSGDIFHEGKRSKDVAYGQILDVSEMPAGKYFAKLKVGNKNYCHTFEKR